MVISLSSNTGWSIFNFRKNIIEALQDEGFSIVVYVPRDKYAEQIEDLGCRVEYIPIVGDSTNPWSDLKVITSYLHRYKRDSVDLACNFTIKPVVYGLLAAKIHKIPSISTVTGLGTAFLKDDLYTKLARQLYSAALRRTNKVFFQNDDDLLKIQKSCSLKNDQCVLVPGSGVDLEKYQFVDFGERQNDTPVKFLYVGRILWDKGLGELVEAAANVKKIIPNVCFQLLGSLDAANYSTVPRVTMDQWTSEGVIQYLGEHDDVRPYLAEADCVVLPSYREGLSRSLLEALAVGRPIITTDVPGCKQLVVDGVNGYSCPARDSECLTERLLMFCKLSLDQRIKMGKNGRLLVEQKYSDKSVAMTYLREIQHLVER